MRNEEIYECNSTAIFLGCCVFGIASIPFNLSWFTVGWISMYDKLGVCLPEELPWYQRACFPCEHAAEKRIPSCEMNNPSLYAFFAPFYWVRLAYADLNKIEESFHGGVVTPAFALPNPLGMH